jgi:hypothetical protein
MSQRNIAIILSGFMGAAILFFVIMLAYRNNTIPDDLSSNAADPTADNGMTVNPREILIEQKIMEKRRKIETKPMDQTFTPDEIEFIVNPRKTVEHELDMADSGIN